MVDQVELGDATTTINRRVASSAFRALVSVTCNSRVLENRRADSDIQVDLTSPVRIGNVSPASLSNSSKLTFGSS